MKKNWMKMLGIALAVCLCACMLLAGCQSTPAPTGAEGSAAEGDAGGNVLQADPQKEYYMVTFVSGIDFWKQCYAGFEDGAALYGATTVYDGAPEYDINKAITVLEQVIAKKPAGIAVTCMNPDAYIEPINKAIEAGIPVVTFDSDAPDSGRYTNLSTKNYEGGVAAAEYMAELLGGKGEVAIVATVGQLNIEERASGFRETIESKYPDIKIVQEVDGETQEEVAAQVTASLIQSNPNVNGIYTANANMGVGAATAIKESGKAGDIKLISFDVDQSLLDLMEEGSINGLIAQSSWNMGFWAFQFLYMADNAPLNPTPGWQESGASPLPAYVDTGVSVVTPENMQPYLDEYAKAAEG